VNTVSLLQVAEKPKKEEPMPAGGPGMGGMDDMM